jgi:lipopolysaccharide transport system permease protein
VGNALISFAIRCLVVVISFMFFRYSPHWQILLFPLLLVPVVALGLGLGFFFAPINTMMNDMGRVLEFAFQFGMFLAPTIYPTPDITTASTVWQKGLYWLHTLNPVSHYIQAIDALIEKGSFHMDTGFWVATVISFLVLAIGWRFFHICEPLLAERL